MKKLLLAFMLVASVSHAGTWRDINTDINESGMDKPLHIGIGTFSSALIYTYLPEDWDKFWRYSLALALPVCGAAIKETTDENFYWSDVGEYALGALAGVWIKVTW